jgi:group II intron reverse transcriptase/maturase
MRTAETVLNVIQDRGQRGLPLEDIYRQLYNPDLMLRAYGKLYRNYGAMTRGTTQETVDSMSLEKVQALTLALRQERYQWTPVRRVYIEKKHSTKRRPLGMPTWSDKVLQEVMRSLLEAYYEPQFSQRSHGFRPHRGCQTALSEVQRTWTGTKWFIEGDIKGCFDHINHEKLLDILSEKLHDNRFLRLIRNMLKAGYLEEWKYHRTLSGTPQGGVISPILSNIYLDKFDQFVEQVLIPAHTRGTRRRPNWKYQAVRWKIRTLKSQGRRSEVRELKKQLHTTPSGDPADPGYRRLFYVRYADDFLLGFIGPKVEAEEIKEQIATFLRTALCLEMSQEKTLITHATTEAARFLGYEIVNQHNDDKRKPDGKAHAKGSRNANGRIGLRLPVAVLRAKQKRYQKAGKAVKRAELQAHDDFSIVDRYAAEYRGYVNYYALAQNVHWLHKLKWAMETSLLKTLAGKYNSTTTAMNRKYQAETITVYGPMKCLQVIRERKDKKPLVARFGGIPLRQRRGIPLTDWNPETYQPGRTEIVKRLLADRCEVCGSRDSVQVHHVRKLADLQIKGRKPKTWWQQEMARRRRKTLVVCQDCHVDIHAGRPPRRLGRITGEPDDVKISSPVRRGVDGKGAAMPPRQQPTLQL